MTDAEMQKLAAAIGSLLRPHLERSPELRDAVGLIGRWLVEEAASSGQPAAAKGPGAPSRFHPDEPSLGAEADSATPLPPVIPAPPRAPSTSVGTSLPISSAIVPLRLGGATVNVPLAGTTEEIGRARLAAISPADPSGKVPFQIAESTAGLEADLRLVAKRCAIKSASCRHAIVRRESATDAAATALARQVQLDMVATAKQIDNCFLWVFMPEKPQPDDTELTRIAVCYDALGAAATLVQRCIDETPPESRDVLVVSMQLLAEASNALRVSLRVTWMVMDDRDQSLTHQWLKREAVARRIFIERFMTADDFADPDAAASVITRVNELLALLDSRQAATKSLKARLNQIRFHAGKVVQAGVDGRALTGPDWAKIAGAINQLVASGIAPADRRIAEAIGPDAASLWVETAADGPSLRAAIARAATPGACRQTGSAEESQLVTPARVWSSSVLQARSLLRGKQLVIVGGERNSDAVNRLIEAFELSHVEWVELGEHGSGFPMRAPIARRETALVLVIVKLAGHLHVDEARAFAKAAVKPCVLLSGGYNPERVAIEILEQASDRLAAS